MTYPDNMDKECIPLCDAINGIPGLRTFESCCGHGTDSFRIWFALADHTKARFLTVMGRVFDRRYGGIEGWTCQLDNTDQPELCPSFYIVSGSITGEQAYKDSEKIAENILVHLEHKNFRQIFLEGMGA